MSATSDLFGHLRSALAGPRTKQGFAAVCEVIGSWPEDDPALIEAAIPHAQIALRDWPDEVRQATSRVRAEVLSGLTPWSLALVTNAHYDGVSFDTLTPFLNAHEPGTLRRLTLGRAGLGARQLDELLGHPVTPGLTHLGLMNNLIPFVEVARSERLSNLESLDLSWCYEDASVFYEALAEATHLERLRHLRMPSLRMLAPELDVLASASFWPRLETLGVWLELGEGSRPLEALLEHVRELDLRVLDLCLDHGYGEHVDVLASGLPAGLDLRLHLFEFDLGVARTGPGAPPRDLSDIEGLKSLRFTCGTLGQLAATSLTRCPTLESLTLSTLSTLSPVWGALSSGFEALRELELDDVTGSDSEVIAWGLSEAAPGLERLEIACGACTDHLLRGMTGWSRPSLRRLTLLDERIGDPAALAALLESDSMPGLEQLTLLIGGGRWGASPIERAWLDRALEEAQRRGNEALGEVEGAGADWERARRAARDRGLDVRADMDWSRFVDTA